MRAQQSISVLIWKWRALAVSNRLTSHQSTPPAVTGEAFVVRLKALNIEKRFAVAISGGRDSMALARLAADYNAQSGVPILALTVDHGLRPEAASEAAEVAGWCEKAGLRHKTLVWVGEKPTAGIQEAARKARYHLLAGAAAEAGFDALLTAHSADDQAETVFMRLSRGAGPDGLCAMQDTTFIAAGAGAPLRLIRPLLGFSRAQLTATVEAFNQPYIDDPSNDDHRYERIRTRALLAALEEQGLLTQKALLRSAARMQKTKQRLRAAEELAFRSLGGCFYGWGGASVERRAAETLDQDVAGDLIRRLIYAVSGADHAPDDDAAMGAFERALVTGSATLGGTLLKVKGERLWFMREPAALLGRAGVDAIGPMVLAPGQKLLWDNRFIIAAPASSGAVECDIIPMGEAGGGTPQLFSGPPEGMLAMPGAYRNNSLIGAPFGLFMAGGNISMVSLAPERFVGGIIRFL